MPSRNKKLRSFPGAAKYESLESGRHPNQLDWHTFARENRAIPSAILLGTICCITVVGYTSWLSRQNLRCLSWAIDCQIGTFARWNANNLTIIQGIATVIYAIGLVCLAYAVQCISETAMWPLHSRRPLSLEQIDAYLLVVRGAIPTGTAFELFKSLHQALFLAATVAVTLTPLAAAPILGSVYARVEIAQNARSTYQVGGGIGRIFAQTNPPVSVGSESLSAYISWSRGLSKEPLPGIRDWIVDRTALLELGNLTARAVRTRNQISCQPFNVTETQSPGHDIASFSTRMAARNYNFRQWNSSDHVDVRVAQTMAVWADDFVFIHTNRSRTRIIFAAFNGSIETGADSQLSKEFHDYPTTISSIACDVDVEFIDDTLIIGKGGPLNTPIATLSSIAGIHVSFPNSTTDKSLNTLNENALWFAAAPIIVCPSVDGAQPMYYRDQDHGNKTLPTGYTKAPFRTYESGLPDNNWTIAELKEFIHVSIGATALASAGNFQADHPEKQIITSIVSTRKLDPNRVVYIAIPVIIILVGEALLMYWNIVLHRQQGISIMRMARISDIIDNLRQMSLLEPARVDTDVSSNQEDISRSLSIKGVNISLGRVRSDDEDWDEPVSDAKSMLGGTRNVSQQAGAPVTSSPRTEQVEPEQMNEMGALLLRSGTQDSTVVTPGGTVHRFRSLHPHHPSMKDEPT